MQITSYIQVQTQNTLIYMQIKSIRCTCGFELALVMSRKTFLPTGDSGQTVSRYLMVLLAVFLRLWMF